MSRLDQLRVLLVDDELEYIGTLAKVLRRRGLLVELASDGPAALAALAADQRFDVVVLDMKMPGMDGGQVLTELRARRPSTPVILMTGHLQAGGGDEQLRRDAYAFLLKPYPIPELIELIREAAGRSSQPVT